MKQRIATAAVLIPLVLLIISSTNPLPISIAAIALAAIGVYELGGMFSVRRVLPLVALGSIALPFYAIYILKARQFAEILVITPIFFIMGVASIGFAAKNKKLSSSVIDLGGLWVSIPLLAIMALHDLSTHARGNPAWNLATPALLALVPVWAGDIAAIFAGKAFGRHPLSKVSPNKTWEGSIANLIAAILAAWGVGVWLKMSLPIAITCGVLAGTLGQLGDLFESYLKRRAGVKDSGRLIPGHGGLLDRIDSILFAAVPIALTIYFGPLLIYKLHGGSQNTEPAKGVHIDQAGARIVGGN